MPKYPRKDEFGSPNAQNGHGQGAFLGAGSATTFTFDPLGRTLTATDQLGHTTTYTYDLVGNLHTTKAADNVVTSTRTYDALNRLLTDKDGKNQTISYAFDALGRMTSYTDAKGATFAFGYNCKNTWHYVNNACQFPATG